MEAPPRSSAPDVSLKDLRECRNFFQPDLGEKKSQGKPDLLGMEKIYFGEMKKRKNYDERREAQNTGNMGSPGGGMR